jgi:hypothetical protein
MAAVVLLVRSLLSGITGGQINLLSLVLIIAAGAATYGGTLVLIQRELVRELWGMVRRSDVANVQAAG